MAEARQACSPPPESKLPRLSGTDGDEGVVTMAAPSPLVLGLGQGLGSGGAGNGSVETPGGAEASAATRPSALTFVQRQELEQQKLIYRYLAAGAPVPAHIVVPIWKSTSASSFGPRNITSLKRLGSPGIDYRYRGGVEPEPGRCRRTDGKKWRCSRDALPGHKYCERHVHRGRGRSRKPVEASVSAAPAIPTAIPAYTAAATGEASAPPPPGPGFSYAGVVLARSGSSTTSGAT